MASKAEFALISDKMKDALRLINSRFSLDWDGAEITTGVDAVKEKLAKHDSECQAFYDQHIVKRLVTVAERQSIDKAALEAANSARKVQKAEAKLLAAENAVTEGKKQAVMSF